MNAAFRTPSRQSGPLVTALACLLALAALWPGPALAAERRLAGVKAFKAAGRGVYVSLDADGPVETWKWFAMDGPARVVVDLPGSWSSGAPNRLDTGLPGLSAVRTGLHPNKARVVLDVDKGTFADPAFEPQENGLRIFLPFAAAPVTIPAAPAAAVPQASKPRKAEPRAPKPQAAAPPAKPRTAKTPAVRPAPPAKQAAKPSPEQAALDSAGVTRPKAKAAKPAPEPVDKTQCRVLDPDILGSYTGGCRNGLAQGRGRAKGKDTYDGEFQAGAKQGKGMYQWANGLSYEGDFADDQRQGLGVLSYRGRAIYKGEFKQGLADGAGTFLFPDGGRYEGEFRKGLRHGYGIYLYPDESIYEGAWVEDKRHGAGIYKWKDSKSLNRYIGLFKNGLRHGHGRILVKDSSTGMVHVEKSGLWANDAFVGGSAPKEDGALDYSLSPP